MHGKAGVGVGAQTGGERRRSRNIIVGDDEDIGVIRSRARRDENAEVVVAECLRAHIGNAVWRSRADIGAHCHQCRAVDAELGGGRQLIGGQERVLRNELNVMRADVCHRAGESGVWRERNRIADDDCELKAARARGVADENRKFARLYESVHGKRAVQSVAVGRIVKQSVCADAAGDCQGHCLQNIDARCYHLRRVCESQRAQCCVQSQGEIQRLVVVVAQLQSQRMQAGREVAEININIARHAG